MISKKEIKTQKANETYNNEKMVATFIRIKDEDERKNRILTAAIHAMEGDGKKKWNKIKGQLKNIA